MLVILLFEGWFFCLLLIGEEGLYCFLLLEFVDFINKIGLFLDEREVCVFIVINFLEGFVFLEECILVVIIFFLVFDWL